MIYLAWAVALFPITYIIARWAVALMRRDEDTILVTSLILGCLAVTAAVMYLAVYYGGDK